MGSNESAVILPANSLQALCVPSNGRYKKFKNQPSGK